MSAPPARHGQHLGPADPADPANPAQHGAAPGHGGHGHGDEHDGHGGHGGEHGDGGASHATLSGYLIGFALSVGLTAVPFWLVMNKMIAQPNVLALVILAFAAMQILVHMVYFLHMNASSEGGWNLMALIFTLVLVFIALSGSLWVMYHLNQNMMPVSTQKMRNMP